MRYILKRVIPTFLTSLITFSPVSAQTTNHSDHAVALVIGNSAYKHSPILPNPKNDAADITAALRKLGFRVTQKIDLDKTGMDHAIRDFGRSIGNAAAAVFFYAGHGLQVNGENYLVPIDAKLNDLLSLEFEAIKLEVVQKSMEFGRGTNVLFLDACRDNPLARNLVRRMGSRSIRIGRGLAAIEPGAGTLISFSTQPGNVALDGTGRNSPFTAALVKELLHGSGDIMDMLINVRRDVAEVTAHKQVPWEHSSLMHKFSFRKTEVINPSRLPSQTTDSELIHWNSVKDSSEPAAIESYIEAYPDGIFTALAHAKINALETEDSKAGQNPSTVIGNCNIVGTDVGGSLSLDCKQ